MHCLIPHWTNSTLQQEVLFQADFAIIRPSKREGEKKNLAFFVIPTIHVSTALFQSFLLLHLSCTWLWASQYSSEENYRQQDKRDIRVQGPIFLHSRQQTCFSKLTSIISSPHLTWQYLVIRLTLASGSKAVHRNFPKTKKKPQTP